MSHNYIVTAQEATGINASVTGNFTGPNDLNLIIAKNNKLEVHLVTPSGLESKLDSNIYGRISALQLFRPLVILLFFTFALFSSLIMLFRWVLKCMVLCKKSKYHLSTDSLTHS